MTSDLAAGAATDSERFGFGANWRRFLEVVDDERIASARESLRSRLGVAQLDGRTFLDAGCGSGLFSLAATQLGARTHSIDLDPDSVQSAQTLRARYRPHAADWHIERGDVLNRDYLAGLGQFDVVYSWGVLHHTGAMSEALDNVAQLVAPGGTLFIAIYNDQGVRSRAWRAVKRLYNRLAEPLRAPYAVLVMAPFELRSLLIAALRGDVHTYLDLWTNRRTRGMSRWHDLIDWVGGYPFEVASVQAIFDFYRGRGFDLVQLSQANSGCNEFVLRRRA